MNPYTVEPWVIRAAMWQPTEAQIAWAANIAVFTAIGLAVGVGVALVCH